MGHTRIENVWVIYEDLDDNEQIIKHKLPKGRFVSPIHVGDFIVFDYEEIHDVLEALPDTYDGINCFRVLEVHHRWDTSREFGSDDVIPVLSPVLNSYLSE